MPHLPHLPHLWVEWVGWVERVEWVEWDGVAEKLNIRTHWIAQYRVGLPCIARPYT